MVETLSVEQAVVLDMWVIRVCTVIAHERQSEGQNFGCRRHRVGAVGAGLRPALTSLEQRVSRRLHERSSLFRAQIESSIRSASTMFGDNDVESSVTTAVRLWWTSRMRGRRFAQLVRHARDVTQQRMSLGVIQKGEPGQREAMPYFFAVLRDLVNREPPRAGQHSRSRSAG